VSSTQSSNSEFPQDLDLPTPHRKSVPENPQQHPGLCPSKHRQLGDHLLPVQVAPLCFRCTHVTVTSPSGRLHLLEIIIATGKLITSLAKLDFCLELSTSGTKPGTRFFTSTSPRLLCSLPSTIIPSSVQALAWTMGHPRICSSVSGPFSVSCQS
jgi:hypothetical protein